MTMQYRWLLCLLLILLAWRISAAEIGIPLDDQVLDSIYARGSNVVIDLDIDVQALQPNSLLIDENGFAALQQLAASVQPQISSNGGAGRTVSLDGVPIPDYSNVVNNINITDNALQNAQSLLNIIALGDVAVGVNLTVIVNPGDTPLNITQMNINWSALLTSLTPPPTPTVP